MLHADPSQRPSAGQASEAFRALVTNQPVSASRGTEADEDHTQPLTAVGAATTALPHPRGGGSGTRLDARPLGQEPAGQYEPYASAMAQPENRQRRRLVTAAVVLFAVAVGGFGLAQLPSARTTAPPSASRQPVAPAELERVVSDYYALLPEHPDNAWTRLSPALHT